MMRVSFLLGLATLAFTAPASAQDQSDIKLAVDAPYVHEATKLSIPAVLNGLPRQKVTALTKGADEYVNFFRASTDEVVTVFVFRHVTGSVPVWADRIAYQITHRDTFGQVTAELPMAAFQPPGQATASGLIASYTSGKAPYKSTGLAIMPLGPDWYVAVRYSSASKTPTELDAAMRGAVNAITWPKEIESQPVAAPISDCGTSLKLSGDSKPFGDKNSSMMSALLMGALVNVESDKKKGKVSDAPPAIWCRDTGQYGNLGNVQLYRPDGARDRYLIAIQDAGTGVWVAPNALAGLVQKSDKPSWSVSLVQMSKTTSYGERDRLPPPTQIAAILRGSPKMAVTTWGKDKKNITLFVDPAAKKKH